MKELRFSDVEIRNLDDEKMVVEGYPVIFNSPATHYGYTETIDSNAFNGCDMKDVVFRYNHKDGFLILARTRNNSLQLTVDDKGLKMRAELIDTTQNKDIYKSIKAGLLDKMSFAFTVSEENYDFDTDTRTILKFKKLYDVAVVDVPFYESTEITARNEDEFLKKITIAKKERLLKELDKIKLLSEIV